MFVGMVPVGLRRLTGRLELLTALGCPYYVAHMVHHTLRKYTEDVWRECVVWEKP